jgi:hypothetical protein
VAAVFLAPPIVIQRSCRNATAIAFANPDQAWAAWLQTYNVTYNSTDIALYRRRVFDFNLAKAYQLNQLAGPQVAVSS